MSELIKSILEFREIADHGTASFCTLTGAVHHIKISLPCFGNNDIQCAHCIFAVGQKTASTIEAIKRVREKPQ